MHGLFFYLLLLLLAAWAIHVLRMRDRTAARIGRIGLLYLLVGYCGVPMLAISIWSLLNPAGVAEAFGFPAGSPFQAFFSWAYLGMSLISLLALRYRGSFLIAPAVCWAVFFAGATFVHLAEFGEHGHLTHHAVLAIFVSHGLISVLLAGALVASGLLKESA